MFAAFHVADKATTHLLRVAMFHMGVCGRILEASRDVHWHGLGLCFPGKDRQAVESVFEVPLPPGRSIPAPIST